MAKRSLQHPIFETSWIDAEVVLDRSLAMGDALELLQEVLIRAAPEWSSKLRIWMSQDDQRSIDAKKTGALKNAILATAAERGPTYQALVERYGHPPFERLTGSAELRGAGSELVVVVSIDEWAVSHLGKKTQLGNSIALQVRHRMVEGRNRATWLFEVFEMLCARLSPAWGSACHPDEYWLKVMSDLPRIEAVGRDFGRFLPGVFWLNFLGKPYRKLIGDERLRSAPAPQAFSVDDGILISLASHPQGWSSPGYAEIEKQVRQHLGPQFFFSKSDGDRPTIAPLWNSSGP